MLKKDGERIKIKYIPRVGKRELAILEDGQVVLYADPVFERNFDELKRYLIRQIQDFLSPLEKDVYVRVNGHIEDFEHLVNGTHRGSINHFNGKEEGGLSVAKSLEDFDKYVYYVQGEEIGKGTDGEPLLKLDTVKVISKKPMTLKQFQKNWEKKMSVRIKELGLSEDDVRLLKSMYFLIR